MNAIIAPINLLLTLIALNPISAQPPAVDRFGGIAALEYKDKATGFFRTVEDRGRWWFVTPEGHGFFSIGACCVHSLGEEDRTAHRNPYRENVQKKYGSPAAWATAARDRLRAWGFNTMAAWSGNEIKDMPKTQILDFCRGHWLGGSVPDFFDPAFARQADEIARNCIPLRTDPWLLGYYLDNELQWAPDWRRGQSIFNRFAALPADAPGKLALIRFFTERYRTPERFNHVWRPVINHWDELKAITRLAAIAPSAAGLDREAFTLLAARQYFKVATTAVRKADPNHLILGCRFVTWTVPRVVVQACGEYCDVVSLNFYELGPLGAVALGLTAADLPRLPFEPDFRQFYLIAKKPLLITEFGFRSMDSGLPNTYPPGVLIQPTVPTQAARAAKYRRYTTAWSAAPYFLGFHWFRYMDEPKGGRFDGENGNYGLVNIADEPYTAFLTPIAPLNHTAWKTHAASASGPIKD